MSNKKFFSVLFCCVIFFGFWGESVAQTATTIMVETFGATPVTSTTNADEFEGYDYQGVYTYTTSGGNSCRISKGNMSDYEVASSGNSVFLASTSQTATIQSPYFQISGINTTGYTNIELSFGFRKESNTTVLSDIDFEYSTDGITWNTITPTHWTRLQNGVTTEGAPEELPTSVSVSWYYITCAASANTIPASTNLSLRFKKDSLNALVRFDDIKLSGVSSGTPELTPSLTINSPANNAAFSICDSIEFGFTMENFTLNMPMMSPDGGFIKITSDAIPYIYSGLPNEIYVNQILYAGLMAQINANKFLLPVGTYDFTMTLVDKDSNLLTPNVSRTVQFTVSALQYDLTISPNGGEFRAPQTVTLSSNFPEAEILYGINGGDLTTYTAPFVLDHGTTTLVAIANDPTGCNISSAYGTVIFNIDTVPATLPEPLPSYTIFVETFGAEAVAGPTKISSYTGFDYGSTFTYSSNYTTTAVSIRTTTPSIQGDTLPLYDGASGTNLLFINKDTANFTIGNISTMGYGEIGLSFGFHKYDLVTDLTTFTLEYSTDGTNWTPINVTQWTRLSDITYGTPEDFPVGSGSRDWYYLTCAPEANTIPETNDLSIRFSTPVQKQMRFDDIKLFAYELIPHVTITSPEDGSTFAACDEITFAYDLTNAELASDDNPDGYLVMIVSDIIDEIGIDEEMLNGDTLVYAETDAAYIEEFFSNAFSRLPEGEHRFEVSVFTWNEETESIEIAASDVIEFTITLGQLTLTISPNGGEFNAIQTVTLTASDATATIFYTTDGTEPTEDSPVYEAPFTVGHGETTVTAIAVDYAGCAYPSVLVDATFNIDTTSVDPIDPVDPTAISELTATTFTVSPNPATDVLHISGNGFSRVEILNFLGQVVDAQQVTNGTAQINIAHLNAGVYFVRTKGDAVVTKKFIKK